VFTAVSVLAHQLPLFQRQYLQIAATCSSVTLFPAYLQQFNADRLLPFSTYFVAIQAGADQLPFFNVLQ
jgi:hypothetical protein